MKLGSNKKKTIKTINNKTIQYEDNKSHLQGVYSVFESSHFAFMIDQMINWRQGQRCRHDPGPSIR